MIDQDVPRLLLDESICEFMSTIPTREDRQGRPIRILLLVDSPYWAIGNFARQVTKHNPLIDSFICSQFSMRQFLKRYKQLPQSFDLVHFLILTMKTMHPFIGHMPIVTTLHHVDEDTQMSFLNVSDAVMTVSQQWYQHLMVLGVAEERLGLVPFGVDLDKFYPGNDNDRVELREKLHIEKNDFVIGFIASQWSNRGGRKGVNCFLEATRKIHQKSKHIVTLIVGPGWKNFVTKLRNEGIRCIYIPYQIDHGEIAKLYRVLDVFWVTSRIEGGPVPLLEAMASGIPCISTPVGASLDLLVHDENGFIVPFDSPERFVELTLHLNETQALRQRVGREAQRTIEKKRQWKHSIDNLNSLYSKAIQHFQAKKNHQVKSENRVINKSNVSHHACDSIDHQQKPIDVFSPKISNWIRGCDHIRGLKLMMRLGEWRMAGHIAGLAIKTSPFDLSLWWQAVCAVVSEGKKIVFSRKVRNGRSSM